MQAFHRWAISYFGISLPKKIDYYKFRTAEDLRNAANRGVGGIAFPYDQALATFYPWHNHECVHIYNGQYTAELTIRLFEEGMAVAHEFDPLHNDWVSRWNRTDPPQLPYIDIVRDQRRYDLLFPLDSILESNDFNRFNAGRGSGVVYPVSGVFVSFLIERYGLNRMKEIFPMVGYDDSREVIKERFLEVFGVRLEEAETAWLAWLDAGI
jgi:hypothetical protein